jgi:hypothetical protein
MVVWGLNSSQVIGGALEILEVYRVKKLPYLCIL